MKPRTQPRGPPGPPPPKPEPPLDPRPVRLSQVEMTELVLPNDANVHGTALGGRVMHFVDICGAIAAGRHCGRGVVTAAVDAMEFLQPVAVGQLLVLRASVNFASRTSMEVGVKVWSEDARTGERRHTSSAYLTFVAVEGGRPVEVPPVLPETPEERRRFAEGEARRADRLLDRERKRERRAAAGGAR